MTRQWAETQFGRPLQKRWFVPTLAQGAMSNGKMAMAVAQFFEEAKRLKCRMLPEGGDLRACLDLKDAKIATLNAEVARLNDVNNAFRRTHNLKK